MGFPACSLYGSLQERTGLTIRSSRCHFTAAIFFGMFVLVCGRAVAQLNSGVRQQGGILMQPNKNPKKSLIVWGSFAALLIMIVTGIIGLKLGTDLAVRDNAASSSSQP